MELSRIDAAARVPTLPIIQINESPKGAKEHQRQPDQCAPLTEIMGGQGHAALSTLKAAKIGDDVNDQQCQRQAEPLHRVAYVGIGGNPGAASCAHSRPVPWDRAGSSRRGRPARLIEQLPPLPMAWENWRTTGKGAPARPESPCEYPDWDVIGAAVDAARIGGTGIAGRSARSLPGVPSRD